MQADLTPVPSGVLAAMVPALVAAANDGIVATAGITEGFSAADAGAEVILLASVATLLAGGIGLGGALYAESAAERDALDSTIEEERRQLDRLPDVELQELAQLYVDRGVSPDLAVRVATELTAHDALAAHAEVEYGISATSRALHPVRLGVGAGLAFALGSAIPVLAAALAPEEWRIPLVFVAAMLGLGATSVILAWTGQANVARTVGRTVLIAIATVLAGLAVGRILG